MRWLSIIGIGEDGLDGLAPNARAALEAAAIVWGGKRHLLLAADAIRGTARSWPSPIENAFAEIATQKDRPIAVLASGDPFHYGVGSLLAAHIPPTEMHLFPKASSLSLAAARLGWALQDCAIVSLHGRPVEELFRHVQNGARILALVWDEDTLGAVAQHLYDLGHGAASIHILEALDGPNERIITVAAKDALARKTHALTVLAIEIPSAGGTIWPLAPGLDDARFESDGQLTRRDIRAITLSRLQPQPGLLLWDVGGGSGSISIEWLLRHPANRAIAIERRPDRATRIAENARRLGAPKLEIRTGEAPAALADLPRPDAVFIGGGVSNKVIIEAAVAALPALGRCVANAVTVEGEQALLEAQRRHGGTMSRIAIDRLDSVGPYRAWRAEMGIVQWVYIKREEGA
jgi:precorrin-6B C5,15-methyltransferase / cobalt-precorrin-6B C5,C15-methyltransferase